MHTIHPLEPERELEAQIADAVIATTALAKADQKYLLRRAFAVLASLKAKRSLSVIHRLDCERGLGDLA